MEIYTPKTKIKLSPVIRNGREFVEVTFGNDNDIRLSHVDLQRDVITGNFDMESQ